MYHSNGLVYWVNHYFFVNWGISIKVFKPTFFTIPVITLMMTSVVNQIADYKPVIAQ